MQQREKQTPETPAFKLSGNNSLLTLSDGAQFELNIEGALINFLDQLPSQIEMDKLRTEILSIQDTLMAHMPDDFSMQHYKHMHRQLNAYSEFFACLFLRVKGGDND